MAAGAVWGARAPREASREPFALVSKTHKIAATSQAARPGQRHQPNTIHRTPPNAPSESTLPFPPSLPSSSSFHQEHDWLIATGVHPPCFR